MSDNEPAFISLAEAAGLCPNKPSSTTTWRWCRCGILARDGKRIHLKHYRVGHRVFTTVDDLRVFFAAIAEADGTRFDTTPATPKL